MQRGTCRCGGGFAHHQAPDALCWCPTCLALPKPDRCTNYQPIRFRDLTELAQQPPAEEPDDTPAPAETERDGPDQQALWDE